MFLKFKPDLFLESAELNRFAYSLDEKGFRKALLNQSLRFGLIKKEGAFTNGKVEVDLNNALNQKTIKVLAATGINNQGLFIVSPELRSLVVPADGNWHWVRIKHNYSTQELGTVSIDVSGNLIGVGTEFTKVLRGNPNYPSRVKFIGSVGNILEYDVLEVINDTTAILVHPAVTLGGVAEFVVESNLGYQIVGTFTSGVAISNDNKFPFNYDYRTIELVEETVTNTRPTYVIGQEFYLARVKVDQGNLVIQDKRIEFWESKGSFDLKQVPLSESPLIGVEAVKWQNDFTTGDRNIVEIAWGMRSTNWSVDSSQNLITFYGSATGGSFKSVDDFTNGDFNGFRLYAANGSYRTVINSIKQGSAINLFLDVLDVDDYSNDGGLTFTQDQLLAVPNCEEVELMFTANPADNVKNVDEKFTFPVNTPIAKCLVIAYKSPSCSYNVQYRYKTFENYTEWTPIVSGSYFKETSYTFDGILKPFDDRVVEPYTSDPILSFVTIVLSSEAYINFISKVYKGDVIGVRTITAFSPGQILELKVNVDDRYQYVTGSINLNDDVYISLSRTNAVEGNEFLIHFNCTALNFGSNKIYIADNYAGGTLTLVKTLVQADGYEMLNRDGGITIRCVFDDTGKWIASQNYDLGSPTEVKMFSGLESTHFDSLTGLGKVKGWYGYSLMDGRNGTVDASDRFILASGSTRVNGAIGGADDVTLGIANIPPHAHAMHGNIAARNTTGGGYNILQIFTNGPDGGSSNAPTAPTGGVGNVTQPFTVKPKFWVVALAQKLY